MTKPPEVEKLSDIEELREIAQRLRRDIEGLQGQARQTRMDIEKARYDINKLFAAVDKP